VPTVRILEAAAEEALEAAAWYEQETPGLGEEFFRAFEDGVDLIEENIIPLSPLPGKAGSRQAKRLVLKRFPYDIVVIERREETLVVAVAHHARDPGYWRDRVLE
jgi:hypothetical protein